MNIQHYKQDLVSNPKSILRNGFIDAGLKVIDKCGGPIMHIVGFTVVSPKSTKEEDGFKITGNVIYNGHYKTPIANRVFINFEAKSYFELGLVGNDNFYKNRIRTFIFTNGNLEQHDTHFNYNYSDELIIICKYWNQKKEDFDYYFKLPTEIELCQ